MQRVEVEYTRGGKRKKIAKRAADILARIGVVRVIEPEPVSTGPASTVLTEPVKKKRGRPKKNPEPVPAATEGTAYKRRDLRADD